MAKTWIYDEDGNGLLCDSMEDAQELIDAGTHSDHPDVAPVKKVVVAPVITEIPSKRKYNKRKK